MPVTSLVENHLRLCQNLAMQQSSGECIMKSVKNLKQRPPKKLSQKNNTLKKTNMLLMSNNDLAVHFIWNFCGFVADSIFQRGRGVHRTTILSPLLVFALWMASKAVFRLTNIGARLMSWIVSSEVYKVPASNSSEISTRRQARMPRLW